MRTPIAHSLLSIVAAIFFLADSGWAQTDGTIQRVTGKGKAIVIRERGKNHTYNFKDDLQLYEIEQVKLLFQNHSNGKLYLLIYVEGSSTAGGGGQCGAGQEDYLIWQALNSKWEQDDHKVELIASCFVTIDSAADSEPYEISQEKLTAKYINYTEKIKQTLVYDSTKPANAWTIEREPMPASP